MCDCVTSLKTVALKAEEAAAALKAEEAACCFDCPIEDFPDVILKAECEFSFFFFKQATFFVS